MARTIRINGARDGKVTRTRARLSRGDHRAARKSIRQRTREALRELARDPLGDTLLPHTSDPFDYVHMRHT